MCSWTTTTGIDFIAPYPSHLLRQSARRLPGRRHPATCVSSGGIVSAVSFTSMFWRRDEVFAPYRVSWIDQHQQRRLRARPRHPKGQEKGNVLQRARSGAGERRGISECPA
jgi:hypothetical protein